MQRGTNTERLDNNAISSPTNIWPRGASHQGNYQMIISQIISLSDCVVVSPRCLCLRVAPSGLRASTCVETRHWRPSFRRLVSLLKVAGVTLRGSVTDQSGGSRISQAGRCFRSWPAHIALAEVRVWSDSDHTHTYTQSGSGPTQWFLCVENANTSFSELKNQSHDLKLVVFIVRQ